MLLKRPFVKIMTPARIAILCVTHGRPEMVRHCLDSCVRQDYPAKEFVVVVNPAEPAAEKAVNEAAPGARVIRTHRNLGFFPALNIALANTEADYVMIVDDDAWFLRDDALTSLMDEFRRDPSLGAVTCNLEGPTETPITGGDVFIRVFTTGFTLMPRKVVAEWVDYFPDMFFRSAGESFLCTQLWEQRRPVKRVEAVRMYHALALTGRCTRDWHFYGLRSQILCALMREPGLLLLPVLVSKFGKSFLQAARKNELMIWLHAWVSAATLVRDALKYRRPVSMATRRLLGRLGVNGVRDLEALPEWQAMKDGSKAG